MKSIAYNAMNISDTTSFDDNIKQLSINIRIKVAKFEPEPTFEKNINEIKADHLKIITSIDMNVSDITLKKNSSSYEHLKYYLMPWILLQPLEISP